MSCAIGWIWTLEYGIGVDMLGYRIALYKKYEMWVEKNSNMVSKLQISKEPAQNRVAGSIKRCRRRHKSLPEHGQGMKKSQLDIPSIL